MDFAPGIQVTDNVRLVELLGKGGMGSVWVADHLSLRTRVAVKFLSAELVKKDPTMRERFNREAELSAQIKSPHVVQIFDHGVMEDGHPYIVMELLEGETLAQRLERERVLSLTHARHVVVQTAKALSRAHKLGIVHRDIKPDNLFLINDEDEEIFVKILDFGIAKQTNLPKVSAVTGTGMMVGTPEYMSPEQVLSARSVDFRSDLWALAVVTYHCLTGGVPFSGETLGSLCVAIANGDFVPPSKYRRELPPGIDAWFLRALAKEAPARFDSAKAMASELSQLLGAVPTESLASMSTSHPIVVSPSNPGMRAISPLAATTPVAARRPPLPIDEKEATTSGVQLYTPAPAQQGPTFAGATLNRERGSRGKRRLAVVAVALVAAVLAGTAAMFFLPGPRETTSAAVEPEPTSQPSVEMSEPEPKPETKPEPKPEPEPMVSASAVAAPKPLTGRLPAPPPKKPPPPKPTETPAEPQPKDRGF
jgi:serine/threonine-protein kinase